LRIPLKFYGTFLTFLAFTSAQAQNIPTPTAAQSSTSTPQEPAPEAAPRVWKLGPFDFSGFTDFYYSYNANHPTNAANGQTNDLYAFDDKANQFNVEAAKLTINHDPKPVGVRVDLLFGRANALYHSSRDTSTDNYIEQAYLSTKPSYTHGTEIDFGEFTSSAGAEVVETTLNWNYSHSILFAWAVPYYHFGIRSSTPVTSTWTAGVQVVKGWNNVNLSDGGATVGLTSAITKPKYTWSANLYTGPANVDAEKNYKNLIDTTLLLTPTSKFSAYINYDFAHQNSTPLADERETTSLHYQGIAFAARQQVSANGAVAARYEYFADGQGLSTGFNQNLQELTCTYEHTLRAGLLTRAEFRHDWSDVNFFHEGNTELVKAQTTATVGLIAFFGPKR
jgi:Putative beta-barrel porin-2, OmpL-like. bbp2